MPAIDDQTIRDLLFVLLGRRAANATACPSEVARALVDASAGSPIRLARRVDDPST